MDIVCPGQETPETVVQKTITGIQLRYFRFMETLNPSESDPSNVGPGATAIKMPRLVYNI